VRLAKNLFVTIVFLSLSFLAKAQSETDFTRIERVFSELQIQNIEEAIEFGKKELKLAKAEDKAQLRILFAEALRLSSRQIECIEQLDTAAAEIDEFEHDYLRTKLFLTYAISFSNMGRNEEALGYLFRSIREAKSTLNNEALVETYLATGEYFRKLQRLELSMQYLDSALSLQSKRPKHPTLLSSIFNRKAAVYTQLAKVEDAQVEARMTDSSFRYSTLALDMAVQSNNIHLQAVSFNELGFIVSRDDAQLAERYFFKADSIWSDLGYPRYQSSVRINRLRNFLNMGKYDEYDRLLPSVMEMLEGRDWYVAEHDLIIIKKDKAALQGNYKLAYELADSRQDLLIRILESDFEQRIGALEAQNNMGKKEQIIEVQKARLATDEIRYRRTNQLLLAMSIAGIALITTIIVLFIFYRNTRKSKLELESNALLLSTSNTALNASLKQQEFLLREVNHRVKNNLQVVSSLLDLQVLGSKDPAVQKALEDGKRRVTAMALLHQHLYQQEDQNSVGLKEFVFDLIDQLKRVYGEQLPTLESDIYIEEMEVSIDKALNLGIILNELVTNSYKYAFETINSPLIQLSIEREENCIVILYEDNGPGFPDFYPDKEEGKLGLKLIYNLAAQIKGKTVREGSAFKIEIPVAA